jgi:hypothetical protein
MNCFLEAVATFWLRCRHTVVKEHIEEEVFSAQDGLEQCRRNMENSERELQVAIQRMSKDALAKKRAGDRQAARSKLLERRRAYKRLERLRYGLDLVDAQIDAIRTSELDKQIMITLRSSTAAMKKAGITLGVAEAENVLSEMDEQIREVNDVTSALSSQMQVADDFEGLEEELELLDEGDTQPVWEKPEPADDKVEITYVSTEPPRAVQVMSPAS